MSDRSNAPNHHAVVELNGAISLIAQFPALAGVDLTILDGEIVLLRGPNGAGKSTLLRLCAGLAPLNGGEGQIAGRDLGSRKGRRSIRRETGLLSQFTFLYDELTVEENLRFWAKANRADPSTVEPVLDRLGLSGRLRDVKISGLSTGQRRRASLAVMVSRRPKLWLLDEPHAGLDQSGRDFVDDVVRHAVRFGSTVLIASHDIERSTELATRTVNLIGGQIVIQIDDQEESTPTLRSPSEDPTPVGAPSEGSQPDEIQPEGTQPDGSTPSVGVPKSIGPEGENIDVP